MILSFKIGSRYKFDFVGRLAKHGQYTFKEWI